MYEAAASGFRQDIENRFGKLDLVGIDRPAVNGNSHLGYDLD
jgi:hypothetical protein